MERFYIITNLMKDPDYGITKEIQKYIEQHGREGSGQGYNERIP